MFLNQLLQTCIIIKRTCTSIFRQIGFVDACISIFSKLELVDDQSKPCTLIYLQKMASCINLQLPIVILKKSILLDMHHHKTYIIYTMIYFVHSNMVFEKNSSTELAALELLDRVLGQMDKHKIPIHFHIDSSKAFDSL